MVFDQEADNNGHVSTLEEDASMAQIKQYMHEDGDGQSHNSSHAVMGNQHPDKVAAQTNKDYARH